MISLPDEVFNFLEVGSNVANNLSSVNTFELVSWFNKVEMFVAAGVILGISLALYMTFKQLSNK